MNRFPAWLKRPLPAQAIEKMNTMLNSLGLHTVCQSARCPNIGECFSNNEATFMILGNICTRNCRFCSVKKGSPYLPDTNEPNMVAEAVKKLNLDHVVITSVTRDDLEDGGALSFINSIRNIRNIEKEITVEILVPDFNFNINNINKIILEKPDIFSHNIETVPRLYPIIRAKADYERSLNVLRYVKNNSDIFLKSGIMIGLGEKQQEVLNTISDIRDTGCEMLTIGQYLRPSKQCCEVSEFIRPELFGYYADFAEKKGFKAVISMPLARSSYKAKEMFAKIFNKD